MALAVRIEIFLEWRGMTPSDASAGTPMDKKRRNGAPIALR